MVDFKQWTICHLSLFMTFVLSGLVINIVQLCLFILIGWWNRSLFRKLNYYLVWMIYAQVNNSWVDILQKKPKNAKGDMNSAQGKFSESMKKKNNF